MVGRRKAGIKWSSRSDILSSLGFGLRMTSAGELIKPRAITEPLREYIWRLADYSRDKSHQGS